MRFRLTEIIRLRTEEGITDLSGYGFGGDDTELQVDIYVEELAPKVTG